jgi:hypothetical protein
MTVHGSITGKLITSKGSSPKKVITAILLLLLSVPATAFELATSIRQSGNATTLVTTGYTKLNLLRQETSLEGSIIASGILTVDGVANIVMWAKVDGVYYFSRMPELQNVRDKDDLDFEIPFHAAEKTVTELVIEVEMLGKGRVSISELNVSAR